VATNAVGELGSRSEELEYSCRLQVGIVLMRTATRASGSQHLKP
jgi:hypothetical protein